VCVVKFQVVGVLVPVSCTRCRASTSGLSTQSSGWAPLPTSGMEISSRGRLPA